MSIIDVSLIEHEDSPCTGLMFVCVCVCRHNLYSDPSAAAVAAGSSGCRSTVLVQKEDERVSDSNAFENKRRPRPLLPLYSPFPFALSFLSSALFLSSSVMASYLLLRSGRPGKTGSKRLR